MKRKIFSNASILVILSVILSFVVTGAVMYGRILENMKETVQEECRFLSNAMTAADGDAAYLKQLCSGAASRVTLIDCEGKVAFDSEASDESMDNHGDRPEVVAASKDGAGSDVRYSSTLSGADLLLCDKAAESIHSQSGADDRQCTHQYGLGARCYGSDDFVYRCACGGACGKDCKTDGQTIESVKS